MKDLKGINKLVYEALENISEASPANKLAAYGTAGGIGTGLAYMGNKAAKSLSTGMKSVQAVQQAKANIAG